MSQKRSYQTTMSSPSAEELVGDYLYNKIHGNPLPHTVSVKECDLYGEEPWEIWKKYGGPESERDRDDNKGFLYLFTKLKKKSVNGKRFLRRVGCNGGVWEGETAPKEIETKFCVGFSKRLRYENPGSDQHGRWIMIEYSIGDYNGKVNDFVLCSVKKNNNTTRGRKRRLCQQIGSSKQEPQPLKKRKEEEEEEDPNIISEILPSTPQLCCSANSLDYSSDELLQNQAPQACTTYPSTPSVQQLCSDDASADECDSVDYNDWAIELAEELLHNQSVSSDSTVITSEILPSTPPLCDKAPELAQQLMLQNQPLTPADEHGDLVNCRNDWTIDFARELLEYHSFTTMESCDTELLPNENCNNLMGWESLS